MTEKGRNIFYLNDPKIEDKSSFKKDCSHQEFTIVLGCYNPRKGIFIQKITDSRLEGVVEVTAAHEMLHAVYDRLGLTERQEIDRQLNSVFQTVSNERIKERMDKYRKKDPLVVDNELHSILGTEVRKLNPFLEEYYRKYFKNRSAIVDLSENYESVFTKLRDRAKYLDVKLNERQSYIDDLKAKIKQENNYLKSTQQELRVLSANNRIQDYNYTVRIFNDRVQDYNSKLADLKEQISLFNQMVEEYNSIAQEEKSLIDSIKTTNTMTTDQ